MFSLIYAWMNGWINNRKAGDLRRHRAHYTLTKNWIDDLFDYELKHQGLNKMVSVLQITFPTYFNNTNYLYLQYKLTQVYF